MNMPMQWSLCPAEGRPVAPLAFLPIPGETKLLYQFHHVPCPVCGLSLRLGSGTDRVPRHGDRRNPRRKCVTSANAAGRVPRIAHDEHPVGVGIRIDIHHYHHFVDPLMVGRARQPAVGARLNVKEQEPMTLVKVTVDTTNETASVEFFDDHNDVTAQPEGSVITFTSSDEAAATVTQRADDAKVADIGILAVGTTDIGASVADADGNPMTEPDGSAWAPIESTTVEVDPGAAVGARMSVAGTAV